MPYRIDKLSRPQIEALLLLSDLGSETDQRLRILGVQERTLKSLEKKSLVSSSYIYHYLCYDLTTIGVKFVELYRRLHAQRYGEQVIYEKDKRYSPEVTAEAVRIYNRDMRLYSTPKQR